ncbi:DUF2779 domain-containing protein [Candidatus Pacearchaeota archaeon CG09_land_8_20_14_0_10_30_9]|nr:MAG: DUF2779 domain-containing protein [Candidatus Pacearchaeota archaeon CG09_land_8_20_14_0_10_30_9]PIZ82357.1 MAG: DUF2779 domain-containing protein [Candidatus Pacearchaeota archaeon CG_4_10_14_0_2_um_filter_30_11]
MNLTKSNYLSGLQCPKLLWIEKDGKEKIPELSEIDKNKIREGYLIEELAKTLFPNLIDISKVSFNKQIEETKKALNKKVPIFQATFSVDSLYSRADFLIPVGNKWDIIEIKSSTEIKDIHLEDLAFQKYVYEKAELKIRNCIVMHVNKEYVRDGNIEPSEILMQTDATEKVEKVMKGIEERINKMFEIINSECPEFSVDDLLTIEYSNFLQDEFMDYLPYENIFQFVRILKKKAVPLYKEGVVKMKDVPDDFKLNDKQKIQRLLSEKGGIHKDKKQIKYFLDNLQYPVYYFDFETINSAIPKFDKSKPYQQIPFQYSLHIQEEPNGELKHISFLAEGTDDPRIALFKSLKDNLGNKGDILVYNQSFEKMVLKQGGELFPEYSDLVKNNFLPRIKDLMKVFFDFHYYNPKQKGSVSIKKVLPLFSDLKYDELEIKKGDVASFEFERVTYGDVSDEDRKKVRDALETYCGLDTLAEVEIVNGLREIIKS